MTYTPLSGTPYTLRAGDLRADVASVGATLRQLRVGERDLVVPFDEDQVRPASRGVILAPWPNRVVDGKYSFAGKDFALPITERARGHAIHGFVRWQDFAATEVTDAAVALTTVVEPRAEYPWRVKLDVEFALTEAGLTQTLRATNLSHTPAPFGAAPHPYLVAGPSGLDAWTLELPAAEVLEVTPDRLIPVALGAVDADAATADRFDWRSPRVLGAVELDHAYTDLTRDADGLATVRVTDPAGSGVAMSWDAAMPWVQVHTADLPGGPAQPGHRAGLAVEPMTCAPDAFNAEKYDFDAGLVVLEPGVEFVASWSISPL